MARGTIIHRLLQSLPDIDPAHRAAAARLYLAQAGAGFLPQEQDHFVAEALAVFDTPAFAPLFGPAAARKCRSSAGFVVLVRLVSRPSRT